MNPFVSEMFAGRSFMLGDESSQNPLERPWTTAIFKSRVEGQIRLTSTGLENDEVGDPVHHGGPEKALFAYPACHYTYWQAKTGLEEMAVAGMGENLSVLNADEASVCVGDIYRFCGTVVQVSQPRQPCWKPARRFAVNDLALQIQQTGRTGWYFRVIEEGLCNGGSELELLERSWPRWTISTCNKVMHERQYDLEASAKLAGCPALSINWKKTLEKRLANSDVDAHARLFGHTD